MNTPSKHIVTLNLIYLILIPFFYIIFMKQSNVDQYSFRNRIKIPRTQCNLFTRTLWQLTQKLFLEPAIVPGAWPSKDLLLPSSDWTALKASSLTAPDPPANSPWRANTIPRKPSNWNSWNSRTLHELMSRLETENQATKALHGREEQIMQ